MGLANGIQNDSATQAAQARVTLFKKQKVSLDHVSDSVVVWLVDYPLSQQDFIVLIDTMRAKPEAEQLKILANHRRDQDKKKVDSILSTYHKHGKIYTDWLPQHGFSSTLLQQFINDLQQPIKDARSSTGERRPSPTEQEKRYKQHLPVYLLLNKYSHLKKSTAEMIVRAELLDSMSHDLAAEIPTGNEGEQQTSFQCLLSKYKLMKEHFDLDKKSAAMIAEHGLQDFIKYIMARLPDGESPDTKLRQHRIKICLFAKNCTGLDIFVAEKVFELGLSDALKNSFGSELVSGNSDEESQYKAYKKYLPKYRLLAQHPQLDPIIAHKISHFGLSPEGMINDAAHIAQGKDKTQQENRLAQLFIEPGMVDFWVATENNETAKVVTAEEKVQDSSLIASQAVQKEDCRLSLPARRVLFAYYLLYPPTPYEISTQKPAILVAAFSHAWNALCEERRLIMENQHLDAKKKQEQLLVLKSAMKVQTDIYYKAQQGDRIATIQTYLYSFYGLMRCCNRNRVNIALTFIVAGMVGVLFHQYEPIQDLFFSDSDNYQLTPMESGAVGGCLTLFSAGVAKVTLDTFLPKSEDDEDDSVPTFKVA